MKRNRKAKILATLGPASNSSDIIEKIFSAGADVFRLNFSHGTIEEHRKNFNTIAFNNLNEPIKSIPGSRSIGFLFEKKIKF